TPDRPAGAARVARYPGRPSCPPASNAPLVLTSTGPLSPCGGGASIRADGVCRGQSRLLVLQDRSPVSGRFSPPHPPAPAARVGRGACALAFEASVVGAIGGVF